MEGPAKGPSYCLELGDIYTCPHSAMLLTALGRHDQAKLVVRAAQDAAPDDALAVTLPASPGTPRGAMVARMAVGRRRLRGPDAAFDRLREMLARPAQFGASGLWCHPLLRPLRADPRFRDLIAEHGGNVAIDPHDRSTSP